MCVEEGVGEGVGCECKCVCGWGGMEENVEMESGCVPSALCPQMTCTIK